MIRILKRILQGVIKLKKIIANVVTYRESVVKSSYGGMGVDLTKFINHLSNGIEEIHDVKIKFANDLHKYLTEQGRQVDKSNKGIFLEIPTGEKYLTVKVSVYPKTVTIDIGCSNEPFTYDSAGALRLVSLLSRIKYVLRLTVQNKSEIPDVGKWIVTHRHCGIDGKTIDLAGDAFNITVNDLKDEFVRGYTKILPDGRVIPRLEVTDTEHITTSELINNMNREVSFKLSSLIQKKQMISDQKKIPSFRHKI